MNIYRISQDENTRRDSYDMAVVCARSEADAATISPESRGWDKPIFSWCSSPKKVKVKLIGQAAEGIKRGIICASFNAG